MTYVNFKKHINKQQQNPLREKQKKKKKRTKDLNEENRNGMNKGYT